MTGLIRAVQERVSDRSVLKLLRAMLRAGVIAATGRSGGRSPEPHRAVSFRR